ncbi:MAG: sigma-70 family RNA polymerase sigma factor [Sedimentisphaerales bacterium]|nr:sigma-70 family RNA polymerase sigma factor [Sedimentisphaerales bacterium]
MEQQPKQQEWIGLVEGDGQVWREFLQQVIPRLYGTFLKSWPNSSLAEELVQKTVFDAVRGRNTFDPEKGSAEEWIFGIARNNIRLEIRKRASRPTVNGDISTYLDLIDTEPLPDELLENKETADIVRTALTQLDGRQQMVLRAKYIEGLSAGEIAKRLEVTEKAVHDLLYRARNSLRARLKQVARADKQE